MVDKEANFIKARALCSSMGGRLAVPFSEEENDLIIALASTLDKGDVWLGKLIIIIFALHSNTVIGLFDEDSSGGGNPLRFQLQDDASTDTSFFENRGRFPWRRNEPNDDRNEDCVEYDIFSC